MEQAVIDLEKDIGLALTGRQRNLVVVNMADQNYMSFVEKWIQRLAYFGVYSYLMIALDREVSNLCHEKHLCCVEWSGPRDIGLVKFVTTSNLLHRGIDVLVSEMDVFWLRNPLPFLLGSTVGAQQWQPETCHWCRRTQGQRPPFASAEEADLQISGHALIAQVNIGFYFLRSNARTQRFMQQLLQYHKANHGDRFDQIEFDELLGNLNNLPQTAMGTITNAVGGSRGIQQLRWRKLDYNFFAGGDGVDFRDRLVTVHAFKPMNARHALNSLYNSVRNVGRMHDDTSNADGAGVAGVDVDVEALPAIIAAEEAEVEQQLFGQMHSRSGSLAQLTIAQPHENQIVTLPMDKSSECSVSGSRGRRGGGQCAGTSNENCTVSAGLGPASLVTFSVRVCMLPGASSALAAAEETAREAAPDSTPRNITSGEPAQDAPTLLSRVQVCMTVGEAYDAVVHAHGGARFRRSRTRHQAHKPQQCVPLDPRAVAWEQSSKSSESSKSSKSSTPGGSDLDASSVRSVRSCTVDRISTIESVASAESETLTFQRLSVYGLRAGWHSIAFWLQDRQGNALSLPVRRGECSTTTITSLLLLLPVRRDECSRRVWAYNQPLFHAKCLTPWLLYPGCCPKGSI
jgi:hypothetical protein